MFVDPVEFVHPRKFAIPGGPTWSPSFRRVACGAFVGDLNSDFILWHRNDADRTFFTLGSLNSYGVVDSPQQFLDDYGKTVSATLKPIAAVFTPIAKNPANAGVGGGWRWCKWGPYLGHGQPTQEYLDDESGFDDGVYIYQMYIVDNVALSDDFLRPN